MCIIIDATNTQFNPLNAKLKPICHLLALLRAQHKLHINRIGVKFYEIRLLYSAHFASFAPHSFRRNTLPIYDTYLYTQISTARYTSTGISTESTHNIVDEFVQQELRNTVLS